MREVKEIKISDIKPHPDNPRKDIGDISELTKSVKVNGIMQNLTVLPSGDGYRALIGHRRLAAAKAAGLETVPCVIVEDMPYQEQIALMLEENMQRNDLTVIEQAESFQLIHAEDSAAYYVTRLMDYHGHYIDDEKTREIVKEWYEILSEFGHTTNKIYDAILDGTSDYYAKRRPE